MQTIGEMAAHGFKLLNRHEIYVILEHIFKRDKTWLLINSANIVNETKIQQFVDMLERRQGGEPLQHILGIWEFCGIDFFVDSSALIPRPETEELVEYILQQEHSSHGLDIGTGTGCIAISLAKKASIFMDALDISEDALGLAGKNIELHSVADKVKLILADIFCFESCKKYDFIVSNPPYISHDEMEYLDASVKDYEPMLALDGGEDGLKFYRAICETATRLLKPEGKLYFEIGYNQAALVQKILEYNGFVDIILKQDVFGKDRMIISKKG